MTSTTQIAINLSNKTFWSRLQTMVLLLCIAIAGLVVGIRQLPEGQLVKILDLSAPASEGENPAK